MMFVSIILLKSFKKYSVISTLFWIILNIQHVEYILFWIYRRLTNNINTALKCDCFSDFKPIMKNSVVFSGSRKKFTKIYFNLF